MVFDLVIVCGINPFFVESLDTRELTEWFEAAKERKQSG